MYHYRTVDRNGITLDFDFMLSERQRRAIDNHGVPDCILTKAT
ncbi:hypothetical protein [Vreelandella zhaodongensis]|nr:hypothetical protein [Halomonas zhaodongensis]